MKYILEDGELTENSVIQKYLITASDGELTEGATIKKYLIVQNEGKEDVKVQVVADFCIF